MISLDIALGSQGEGSGGGGGNIEVLFCGAGGYKVGFDELEPGAIWCSWDKDKHRCSNLATC